MEYRQVQKVHTSTISKTANTHQHLYIDRSAVSLHLRIRVGQKYGVHTVFLAGEIPNIRSYTVYLYGSFGRGITKYTVIYGAYTRFFWQGNYQIYGHIRCIDGIFGREITKYTVIYGVLIRFWPSLLKIHPHPTS